MVTVEIRPSLPVKGLDLILGNDLAGGKVSAYPCVIMLNISLCQDEAVSKDDTKSYLACAIMYVLGQWPGYG